MPNKYCDPSLYTYSATPTWNVAQEGDGSATTMAACAIASIDCTSASASATNTLTIAGATLTCVASGAGNNQFNAGSGSTLASNLVTAINRTTNTVTVANQGSGETWYSARLQDWCWARVDPNNANVVQIMTRAGSARFNYATNSGVAITTGGSWGGSPTITQFDGGVGGAWGYLQNMDASIWPSGVLTSGLYGIFGSSVNSLAGIIANGDVVHIRANNYTLTSTGDFAAHLSVRNIGTVSSPVTYKVGDISVWSGDSANSTLTVTNNKAGNNGGITVASGAHITIDGGLTSAGEPRFIVRKTHANGQVILTPSDSANRFIGIKFEATGTGGANANAHVRAPEFGVAASRQTVLERCVFQHKVNNYFVRLQASSCNFSFIDCTFDNTGNASPNTGVIETGDCEGTLRMLACKMTNFVAGSALDRGTGVNRTAIELRDCSLGNVTAIRHLFTRTQTRFSQSQRFTQVISSFGGRDFILDTHVGEVEHVAARTYPTLNAVLPDGMTKWSWRVHPTTVSGNMNFGIPFVLPRIGKKNPLGESPKHITLEFCLEQNISFTKADIWIDVVYRDDAGNIRVESTRDVNGGALSSSSVTWSSESGGFVIFDDGGGTQYFVKYKLELTTAHAVAAETEVAVYVNIAKSVSVSSRYGFIDPDFTIANA